MKRKAKRKKRQVPKRRKKSTALARRPEPKQETALTVIGPPPSVQLVSAVPTVLQTAANLEKVRRFVSRCMNVDLQRELRKLKGRENLTIDQRVKEEIAIREKFEIDWGTIPGVDKPFLKQPGAEKFCFWLNIRPKFIKVVTDLGGGHMEIACHVVAYSKRTGEEVFEGPECSCTTMESNYRFRWAERDTTQRPKPTTDQADALKMQGLGRWRKKAIWAHGRFVKDEWVWYDRIENPNIYDERNKVRQIGEKRALVKLVRNMGALSEIFTSDPSEWEIPEEELGTPQQDAEYTKSGRHIVTEQKQPDCTFCHKADAPDGCPEPLCPIRNDKNYLKLTPEQKEIVNREISKKARQAESKPAAIAVDTQEVKVERTMTYLWIDSDQEALVEGNPEIKRELQQILAKYVKSPKFEIRVNGDELEALKYELKGRDVKFTRRYPKV